MENDWILIMVDIVWYISDYFVKTFFIFGNVEMITFCKL